MKIQKKQEIEFFGTKTGNANSIALGYATETKNFGEVAVGVMNKSTAAKDPNSSKGVCVDPDATLFSVGCGGNGERKNALEVKGDGSVIIPGENGNINIADDFSSVMTAISDEKTQRETADNEIKSTLDTKTDKDKSITEIKRLTGKHGREWNAETDVDMCYDFYQYLLKRGNYCGIYIKCSKSKIIDSESARFNFSEFSNLRLVYSNDKIRAIIDTGDETFYQFSVRSSNLNEDFIVAIVPAKTFYDVEDKYLCIVLYNISNPGMFRDLHYDKNAQFDSFSIVGFDKVYELPACVQSFGFISYTNSNNYRVKYADGRYALINTDKNVVIGGKDYNADIYKTEGFVEDGTAFTRGGTLEVNGSATVRDLTTRSITANGSVTINNKLHVEKSINTDSTLKAGETTINGTLHVEDHDIKTKSVYPANTGGSSLKDPSIGKVPGNYVVTKSNLGKGAHNYDKLFVENIYWSDCTDINNPSTSLNNEGTIQILNARGINRKPVWIFDGEVNNYPYCDFLGIYATNYISQSIADTIVFEHSVDSGSEDPLDRRIYFNIDYCTISNTDRDDDKQEFVFGNGVHYDEYNKIPSNFISLSNTINLPNEIDLNFNEPGYIYLENTVDSTAPITIKLKNESGLYLDSGRNGKSNLVYATDGSWFDLTTKADTSAIPTKVSQLTNDSNFVSPNDFATFAGLVVHNNAKIKYIQKSQHEDEDGYLVAEVPADRVANKVYAGDGSLFDVGKLVKTIDCKVSGDWHNIEIGYTNADNERSFILVPNVTKLAPGIMSAADKVKLDSLPSITDKLVNITTASTAEEVVTKFNALLADLKAKGYMEADA